MPGSHDRKQPSTPERTPISRLAKAQFPSFKGREWAFLPNWIGPTAILSQRPYFARLPVQGKIILIRTRPSRDPVPKNTESFRQVAGNRALPAAVFRAGSRSRAKLAAQEIGILRVELRHHIKVGKILRNPPIRHDPTRDITISADQLGEPFPGFLAATNLFEKVHQ